MAPSVMGDAAVATRGKKEHLVLEGIRTQRPAMAEDDGLTRAPVIVMDLCSVFSRDRAHE